MTKLKTLIQELYEEELSDNELTESMDNIVNLFLILASVAKREYLETTADKEVNNV